MLSSTDTSQQPLTYSKLELLSIHFRNTLQKPQFHPGIYLRHFKAEPRSKSQVCSLPLRYYHRPRTYSGEPRYWENIRNLRHHKSRGRHSLRFSSFGDGGVDGCLDDGVFLLAHCCVAVDGAGSVV